MRIVLTAAQAANLLLTNRTEKRSSLGKYFMIMLEISVGTEEIGETPMMGGAFVTFIFGRLRCPVEANYTSYRLWI